jgi:hypothetical protein
MLSQIPANPADGAGKPEAACEAGVNIARLRCGVSRGLRASGHLEAELMVEAGRRLRSSQQP